MSRFNYDEERAGAYEEIAIVDFMSDEEMTRADVDEHGRWYVTCRMNGELVQFRIHEADRYVGRRRPRFQEMELTHCPECGCPIGTGPGPEPDDPDTGAPGDDGCQTCMAWSEVTADPCFIDTEEMML